jgi:hypothetical protein
MHCTGWSSSHFCGLTSEAFLNIAGCATWMAWSKTGTSLGLASIELTFYFTVLVEALDGKHVDVTQLLMVKEKFLLCLGQILILVGQHFHV